MSDLRSESLEDIPGEAVADPDDCSNVSYKDCAGDLEQCNGVLVSKLKELLPTLDGAKVHVCSIQPTEAEDGFNAVFRLSYKEPEEIQNFMIRFSKASRVAWRVLKKQKDMSAGRRNYFWARYQCQRGNARILQTTKKHHQKHTDCAAALTVTLKRVGKRCRSKDPHLPHFPAIVVLRHQHNHPLIDTDMRRRKEVPEELRVKFRDLFLGGHSPASALDLHRYDLQMIYGAGFFELVDDRSVCPDIQFCYRQYAATCKKKYHEPKDDELYLTLQEKIKSLENVYPGTAIRLKKALDNNLVLVLCTPLMFRVHKLNPHSADVVFLDSSGGLDKSKNHTYVLLTRSNVGGLPLGILMTPSESLEALQLGLLTLNDILGNDAYYSRGTQGPRVFVTDDNDIEQLAVGSIFPNTAILVSIRHMLASLWRWALDAKNGIAAQDRALAMTLIRDMAFASTDGDLNEAYYRALHAASNHTNFTIRLGEIWEKRDKWSIARRSDLPIRGVVINNIAEASIRVVKDKFWHRLKAYNTVQVLDFLVSRHDQLYEHRIIDYLSNKMQAAMQAKFLPFVERPLDLAPEFGGIVTQIYQDTYDVTEGTSVAQLAAIAAANVQHSFAAEVSSMEHHNIPQQQQQPNIAVDSSVILVSVSQQSIPFNPPVSNSIPVVPIQRNQFQLSQIVQPSQSYQVNLSVGACSCPIGSCGAPCRHQYAVVQKFDVCSLCFTPSCSDLSVRSTLFEIATGLQHCENDWFESINKISTRSVNVADDENSLMYVNNESEEECDMDDLDELPIENRVRDTRSQFVAYMHSILDKLEKQPALFEPALRRFTRCASSLKLNTDILSAMNTWSRVCRKKDSRLTISVPAGKCRNSEKSKCRNSENCNDGSASSTDLLDYDITVTREIQMNSDNETHLNSIVNGHGRCLGRLRKKPRRYTDETDGDSFTKNDLKLEREDIKPTVNLIRVSKRSRKS